MPANKKTATSKIKDRTKALHNPPPAGKPKAAGSPKAAGEATLRAAGKATLRAASALKGAAKNGKAKSSLKSVVIDALADMKALEVKVLDVRGLTDIADFMVIASGTSDRHVRSVAQRVVEKTKEAGFRPHGIEGQQDSDWVLIDLSEMIVHVMLPRVREFYGLEKLWDMSAAKRAARA
ncbi:MAG TPA: ribosome silencing factor [Steroidobacteraceae bacterium]|nr:ribosome silencing factor [Steroidobacteraceae bacterium]